MTFAAWATLLGPTLAGAQQRVAPARFDDAQAVEVWLSYSEYRPFEKAEVGFSGPAGSYVLVMRISDDGYQVRGTNTVEILYPHSASRQVFSAGNRDELTAEFKILGGPGTTGVVFAVASSKPFDLGNFPQRIRWQNYRLPSKWHRQDIAGRVLEKLSITPADILGVAVDAYDVVKSYENAPRPLRSHNDLSTNLFRRCEQGSKERWCESFAKR